MSITLYTAPNCLRCKIVKDFLGAHGQEFTAYDFKEEKEKFDAFFRANRASIYRNPEGLEFPILDDGTVIKQGSGEIIAYLLSNRALEACVKRSDLLHGWISGLNLSACPPDEDTHFLELLQTLSKGGLQVFLETDGRRSDLLEKVLTAGSIERLALNILGPAHLYPELAGGTISIDDLKKSIAMTRTHKDHVIRLYIVAFTGKDGKAARIDPAQAAEAAKMVFEACGERQLPFWIEAAPPAKGMEKLEDQRLLPYRSKVRSILVKTEIRKA